MLTITAIVLRRSAVNMKLRLYKEALQDADAAIEADKSFAKGYLRRAAANEALENFDDAVRDYEKVRLLAQGHILTYFQIMGEGHGWPEKYSRTHTQRSRCALQCV